MDVHYVLRPAPSDAAGGADKDENGEDIYIRTQLEKGETHDPYWNAAMKEMRETGYMHNYKRMHWGKKIIEWSKTRGIAYQTMLAFVPRSDRRPRNLLRAIKRELSGRKIAAIAVLVDGSSSRIASWLAARWPTARVVVIDSNALDSNDRRYRPWQILSNHASDSSRRHAILTAHGPFDALIDARDVTPTQRWATVHDTVFHLRRGGRYVIPAQADDNDERSSGQSESELTDSEEAALRCIDQRPNAQVLVVEQPAMPKMRYAEMDTVLELRPERGVVLDSKPSGPFAVRCEVVENRDNPAVKLGPGLNVPAVRLREYPDTICAPFQVLMSRQVLLPDTFRQNLHKRLLNYRTEDVSERFARYDVDTTEDLAGHYFYLGSEHPQHFGHLLTEQLSRMWAWPMAKRIYPDLKALVDLRPQYDRLQPYEVALFTAAGIEANDIVPLRAPTKVQRLLAATPMFVNPQYVHPDIVETWRRTGRALELVSTRQQPADRIFVSRRSLLGVWLWTQVGPRNRRCHNAREVENFFSERGFEVIYPEDHSLADQVRIFRGARVIAGFAGSGMFTLALCEEPKHVILLWPEGYVARNEFLICAAAGHRMAIVWCVTDIRPGTTWNPAAYRSSYTFDFASDGPFLERVVAEL